MQFTSNEFYMLLNLHPAERPLWLRGADLSRANAPGVELGGANLATADLSEAILFRADFSRAVLAGAEEQLAQAKTLAGATMPDLTVHE
jgi:uncharacterized protein YjbI with pentapeptide repeats